MPIDSKLCQPTNITPGITTQTKIMISIKCPIVKAQAKIKVAKWATQCEKRRTRFE